MGKAKLKKLFSFRYLLELLSQADLLTEDEGHNEIDEIEGHDKMLSTSVKTINMLKGVTDKHEPGIIKG